MITVLKGYQSFVRDMGDDVNGTRPRLEAGPLSWLPPDPHFLIFHPDPPWLTPQGFPSNAQSQPDRSQPSSGFWPSAC